MTLRDKGDGVGGKLVGRVGVEPTTKRLRAALPNEQTPENSAELPLSDELNSAAKDSAFHDPLRGLRFWLPWILGVLLAAMLVGITIWSLQADPPKPPPNACPPSDAANPWCVR